MHLLSRRLPLHVFLRFPVYTIDCLLFFYFSPASSFSRFSLCSPGFCLLSLIILRQTWILNLCALHTHTYSVPVSVVYLCLALCLCNKFWVNVRVCPSVLLPIPEPESWVFLVFCLSVCFSATDHTVALWPQVLTIYYYPDYYSHLHLFHRPSIHFSKLLLIIINPVVFDQIVSFQSWVSCACLPSWPFDQSTSTLHLYSFTYFNHLLHLCFSSPLFV